MHGIAGDDVKGLGQQRLGVADEQLSDARAGVERLLQWLDRHTGGGAGQLHQIAPECLVGGQCSHEARDAFPAENATGNFVKIVRRVPVKIVIDSGLDNNRTLPLGISVTPTVTVR